MLSIPNRAAVCFFGFALSGCMQSMPTAETITRPTMEAFTRLSSWTPWRSSTEPPQPVVTAVQTSPPVVEPAPAQPAPPEAQPEPKPRPVVRPAPQLASPRLRPTMPAPAPAIIPAAVVTPAPAAAQATPAPADASLPGRMICQTSNQPGERVRMECKPVE